VIERYAFVTIATSDLARAREFWVHGLEFPVTEEQTGQYFIVNAGGLRLCVDRADESHQAGSTDPILGFKVASVSDTLVALAKRGIKCTHEPTTTSKGAWAEIREPDGRFIILTEDH
jgi:catechol 2,3-dioxygenase-like lactoylglutathione lyase family enzyme